MCVVSMIMDYGKQYWPPNPAPVPFVVPGTETWPGTSTTIEGIWDGKRWEKFKKLVEAAEEVDEAMGEKDCVDPEKAEWADAVEESLGIEDETDSDPLTLELEAIEVIAWMLEDLDPAARARVLNWSIDKFSQV